jgi:hypothetical protein
VIAPRILGLCFEAADPRWIDISRSHFNPALATTIQPLFAIEMYMPALSAMRYNPAVVALVDRLKAQGRLECAALQLFADYVRRGRDQDIKGSYTEPDQANAEILIFAA